MDNDDLFLLKFRIARIYVNEVVYLDHIKPKREGQRRISWSITFSELSTAKLVRLLVSKVLDLIRVLAFLGGAHRDSVYQIPFLFFCLKT